MGIANLHDYMARIEQAVRANLAGAQVIAIVPNPRDNIEREGYWERSYHITWQREIRGGQPSPDADGHVYATHRVHVNSADDAACFDGHYDQSRAAALADMCQRSGIKVPEDN